MIQEQRSATEEVLYFAPWGAKRDVEDVEDVHVHRVKMSYWSVW